MLVGFANKKGGGRRKTYQTKTAMATTALLRWQAVPQRPAEL